MARVSPGEHVTVDLVIRTDRVVVPDGGVHACAIAVTDGAVVGILPRDAAVTAEHEIELADDEVLLPGLVDTHVHVNEPGRTDWEGFASATAAAAAGGVTTLIDMPLNSIPPTVDVAALSVKRAAAAAQCHVDVGFWGGAVPGNRPSLRALHNAGVFGFKAFLVDSGVSEFPPLSSSDLADVLADVAALDALLIVHAEDADALAAAPACDGRSYAAFVASRPAAAEQAAVERLIAAARVAGARVHVVHLSSREALAAVNAARAEGVRMTAETCPHYLTLTVTDVPDGATQFKCCPPIRDATHRDALWRGLADGDIDLVVSDHSPAPPALKNLDDGNFGTAWGGIASVQLGLPVVWSAARSHGHKLGDVVGWMARGPAQLVGLTSKGRIALGADADLIAFAPDEAFTVDPTRLQHRHPLTPYAGRDLTGVVRRTWLRGHEVYSDTGGLLGEPRGRLLERVDG
ncbi:MAG TPA: allantoinase AllB [Jatrophihabitans sp.]